MSAATTAQTRAATAHDLAFHEHPVRVRVPATSANVGPGFDALGLALAWYDEVEARVSGAGVEARVEGEGDRQVGSGEDNLVVRSARAAFDRMGVQPPGLRLTCTNRIPHGRGIGSSAAAIVAGVSLARALVVDAPMSDDQAFSLAVELEGHPDNVAACLAGGLTVAWRSEAVSRRVRLEPDESIVPVIVLPDRALSTTEARGLLPDRVPHRDAAAGAGRAALLVAALTSRPELLFEATEDWLHQRYRIPAMPQTAELLAKLRAKRLPAVISGAGPSILVLAQADTTDSIEGELGTGWRVYSSGVDREGARVRTIVPGHAHDTYLSGE